jgi:hypothetical protein
MSFRDLSGIAAVPRARPMPLGTNIVYSPPIALLIFGLILHWVINGLSAGNAPIPPKEVN